jgi:hypothetical protein
VDQILHGKSFAKGEIGNLHPFLIFIPNTNLLSISTIAQNWYEIYFVMYLAKIDNYRLSREAGGYVKNINLDRVDLRQA